MDMFTGMINWAMAKVDKVIDEADDYTFYIVVIAGLYGLSKVLKVNINLGGKK